MGRWVRRTPVAPVALAVLAALLATIPAVAATATAARGAAPRCPDSAPAAGPRISAAGWAQQRYAPERLSALADGHDLLVAVIDSGVAAGHPQLASAVVPGRDLLDGGAGTLDCVSHGTAVASIIAARPVPGVGFRGLAPRSRILPVRVSEQQVLDTGTAGRTVSAAGLAGAIRYAVTRGVAVINLSIVLYRDDPAVRAAVRDAVAADVVVVAAVGNLHDLGDPTPYPAAYPGVVGVGAIGPDGNRFAGSQVGSYVDIVAPGMQITAANRSGGHATYEGSSFAAPFVSATAALLRQYRPGERADTVVRRILATADPAPGGPGSPEYGHGVLNPYRALAEDVTTDLPELAGPLRADAADPVDAAALGERANGRQLALRLAAAGVLAAVGTLVVAGLLPLGRRRRWRPDRH